MKAFLLILTFFVLIKLPARSEVGFYDDGGTGYYYYDERPPVYGYVTYPYYFPPYGYDYYDYYGYGGYYGAYGTVEVSGAY